jgi:DNA polymerase-4
MMFGIGSVIPATECETVTHASETASKVAAAHAMIPMTGRRLTSARVGQPALLCGSRLPRDIQDDIRYASLTALTHWILHVDLDQFLVAVELRRRPSLRGQPVVVGGSSDPSAPRKVVTSASYEARGYGVHAGMPLRTALRRCPQAVFIESDKPAYNAASAEVMDVLRRLPVVVEVWGWDEAALGAKTEDPEGLALEVQRSVLRQTGLSCSVGIGDNKLRAKIATGFAKPAGVYRLTVDNWAAVMGHRPVDNIVGIGRRTAAKLATLDVRTVHDLATADVDAMRAAFGPRMGPWYVLMGRGIGSTEVSAVPRARRSLSHQITFATDLVDRVAIERELVGLADEVTKDVVAEGRNIVRVAIVVRWASFFTRTRVVKLAEPTTDAAVVSAAAISLLARVDTSRPIRLLGVRADLSAHDPVPTGT